MCDNYETQLHVTSKATVLETQYFPHTFTIIPPPNTHITTFPLAVIVTLKLLLYTNFVLWDNVPIMRHFKKHNYTDFRTPFTHSCHKKEAFFSLWDKCNLHNTNPHIHRIQPIFFYNQLRTTHHSWDRLHQTHLNLLLIPLSVTIRPNHAHVQNGKLFPGHRLYT